MPGRTAGTGTRDGVAELVQLVIAYAKQETVDPVVKQVKTLGKGLAGAVLLATGTVLLALGFLRALQTEFGGGTGVVGGWFGYAPLTQKLSAARALVSASANPYPYGYGAHLSGDWTWVPYMGGALFCLLVAGFCVLRIVKGAVR
jgi:hypothetical protein